MSAGFFGLSSPSPSPSVSARDFLASTFLQVLVPSVELALWAPLHLWSATHGLVPLAAGGLQTPPAAMSAGFFGLSSPSPSPSPSVSARVFLASTFLHVLVPSVELALWAPLHLWSATHGLVPC